MWKASDRAVFADVQFRDVHQKWIEGGSYELCIEDVRDEIWDMGGTVASMLIDVLGSWAMTTEKTFYKKRKNQKKNKFCVVRRTYQLKAGIDGVVKADVARLRV
ncbi:hypothetical protein Tco_0788651 [Tanacetum coccineum]